MNPQRPSNTEYLPYFSKYIDFVPDGNINTILETQFVPFEEKLLALTPDQTQHRYAPDKWNVLEVIGHLSDAERVFTFRALHIARGDPSPLPGFDQDTWSKHVDVTTRNLDSLLLEWRGVRMATISLFSSLDSAAWTRIGTASGHALTPRACAYIIAGHLLHHQALLREQYGLSI
jgi:hypothetical protein